MSLGLYLLSVTAWAWTGTGTEDDPYLIGSAADLEQLAQKVYDAADAANSNPYEGTYFKLTNNITLTGEWTPIGKYNSIYDTLANYPFSGTFDGDGHTIRGLSVTNNTRGEYVGLFACLSSGGTIKNLAVSGSVTATGDSSKAGGVVGINKGSVINCSNAATVRGGWAAGGIVGLNDNNGEVADCRNTGSSENGPSHTGGVAGSSSSTVENCYNTGKVTGSANDYGDIYSIGGYVSGSYVGGVMGNSSGSVTDCYNTGVVSGGRFVGGVIGLISGTVEGCYNTGSVTGGSEKTSSHTGGVVGWISYGTVTNCYNTAKVTGEENVGGVAGQNGFFSAEDHTAVIGPVPSQTATMSAASPAVRTSAAWWGTMKTEK